MALQDSILTAKQEILQLQELQATDPFKPTQTSTVSVSQTELLMLCLLRLVAAGGGGAIDNDALAEAIADKIALKTLQVSGDSVNESALAGAIASALVGVTQPISAASLPLPSGAATSAKQPALGTAGTPSTDVITVQGIANGVAQPVNQSSNVATTTVEFTALTTSAAFAIANRLALIVIPVISSAPTLTLQVSLDGGTTWVSTSVAVTASASSATAIEADSLAKVSGAFGLTNAFRFSSSSSITATLNVRSITQ